MARLVDTSPGQRDIRDEIVTEELDRALQNIELRLDRDATTAAIATGPEGGEYARFVASVATRFGTTAGSTPSTPKAAWPMRSW